MLPGPEHRCWREQRPLNRPPSSAAAARWKLSTGAALHPSPFPLRNAPFRCFTAVEIFPPVTFLLNKILQFCLVLVDDEPAEMLEIRERGTWRKSSDKTSRMLGNSSLSDGRQPTDYSVRWCLSVNGRYKREIPPSGGQKKNNLWRHAFDSFHCSGEDAGKPSEAGGVWTITFFQKIQSNQKRRGSRRLLEDDEITLCSDWLRKWTPNRAAINADYSDAFHLIPTIRMRRSEIKSVSLWNNSLHKFIVVTFRTLLNFAANLYFRKFHWF